ncbi:MAG: histidine--tRNA ligase [Rikenellaceae bacterium]
MAVQKPSIPQGTRDFGPNEMVKREYIFSTVKSVFVKYGYLPLETPTMENLSTLLGKYGEEGDKLLFKVLNSGDFLKKLPAEVYESGNSVAAGVKVSEKGLRYDLTVPFARYVVQHQNEISFPFKRYQIQPVWRADRPQKGRYREFFQCDVDVVGSDSLLNEVELIQIVSEVFKALKINITLKLNNRKILFGIAESIGYAEKMMDITVAIDKLDKIGIEAVCEELRTKDISDEALQKLTPILELSGTNRERLAAISEIIAESETGMLGIQEVTTILDMVDELGVDIDLELDLSLARGLNYYTGAIFEVKAKDYAIGSISGGGRYDDLTGIFGLKGVSGVGISFGADRIYDVLTGLDLFPDSAKNQTKVIFINFGEKECVAALKLAKEMRAEGIATEVYPDAKKMKKQMEYANRRGVNFVAIIGENELAENKVTVKDMISGEQHSVAFSEVAGFITSKL